MRLCLVGYRNYKQDICMFHLFYSEQNEPPKALVEYVESGYLTSYAYDVVLFKTYNEVLDELQQQYKDEIISHEYLCKITNKLLELKDGGYIH